MRKKKEEPIRIAHIVGKWVGGGVEAFVMNYYRHIDRSKIQFDFLCDDDSTNIPYDEIKKLGGRVIIVPPYQKVFKYHRELKRIFKENKYKIVHSHINTLSVFPLFAAKCAGIPVRIAHSHSTTNKKELLRTVIKILLRNFSKLFSTDYFACSESAAIFQFGNNTFREGKVHLVNNAIDVERFSFNSSIRTIVRNDLRLEDETILLGNVGRLVSVKNQKFIIDIFKEYHLTNKNSKLLIVGDGPLKSELYSYAKNLSLDSDVIFVGQQSDTKRYYMAMDVFLFPSLYEGFGLSLIEAQCSGLKCLASSNIPKATKLTNLVSFIDLTQDANFWSLYIEKNDFRSTDISSLFYDYDINFQSKILEKKYFELLER